MVEVGCELRVGNTRALAGITHSPAAFALSRFSPAKPGPPFCVAVRGLPISEKEIRGRSPFTVASPPPHGASPLPGLPLRGRLVAFTACYAGAAYGGPLGALRTFSSPAPPSRREGATARRSPCELCRPHVRRCGGARSQRSGGCGYVCFCFNTSAREPIRFGTVPFFLDITGAIFLG